MMRFLGKLLAIAALGASLAGCMQTRPAPVAACDYRAIPLSVDPGRPQWSTRPQVLGVDDRFATELRTVVAQRGPGKPAPQFLVLSGGSQHGAFGAGFFHGLKSIPDYDVVTGVSTGSLQSTFLFLANRAPPKDRTYGWVDGPLAGSITPGASSAGDLALAYSIDKEGDVATPSKGGIIGGLSRGALATFGPLEARLQALISHDTLKQIAEEQAKGRKLFVGTVNLDDGKGYAIDLTELAGRVDQPGWEGRTATLQSCYIQALVASSSVPPSAYPVTLTIAGDDGPRTNMYMDGGARFGVFLEQIVQSLGGNVPRDAKVTLIVNGILYSEPWNADGTPMLKWSSLTVAARAVSLLENQVYRFSVASAEQFGIDHGGLAMAFISNEGIPGGEDPDKHVFNGKTCEAWNAIDNLAKPLEFHPLYMGCLSDYGRVRGVAGQWNRVVGGATP